MQSSDSLQEHYQIKESLGNGSFASVRLAIHIKTQQKVAVKIIDKSKLDSRTYKKVAREATLMKNLEPHPHIISLYHIVESPSSLCMVMEYAQGGDMLELLSKRGRFTEDWAAHYFAQLVSAIAHCHENFVVHRDIKTENLLLVDSNLDRIKLADFGFSNVFKLDSMLNTWCGSPTHAAPELFEARAYIGPEVDIWALGIVLYIFVCGSLPFKAGNLPQLRHNVLTGIYEIPSEISSECGNLIQSLLQVEPLGRPTILQVAQHAFLTSASAIVTSHDALLQREQLSEASRGSLREFMKQNYPSTTMDELDKSNSNRFLTPAYAGYCLERERLIFLETTHKRLELDLQTSVTTLDSLRWTPSPNRGDRLVSDDAIAEENEESSSNLPTLVPQNRRRRSSVDALANLWADLKQSPQRLSHRISEEWSSVHFDRLTVKAFASRQRSQSTGGLWDRLRDAHFTKGTKLGQTPSGAKQSTEGAKKEINDSFLEELQHSLRKRVACANEAPMDS